MVVLLKEGNAVSFSVAKLRTLALLKSRFAFRQGSTFLEKLVLVTQSIVLSGAHSSMAFILVLKTRKQTVSNR